MRKIIGIGILLASSFAFADAVTTTTTDVSTMKSVPIEVIGTTFTVQGTEPTEGDFYYAYQGHRCFKDKRTDMQEETALTSATTTTTTIYCYKE